MRLVAADGRRMGCPDINPLRRNDWEMMPFAHNAIPYWKDPVTGRQLMTDRVNFAQDLIEAAGGEVTF